MAEKFSIGKVSSACDVPIKTLRYYDEIGLLKPAFRDNDSNYRYYSKEQMTQILCIRRYRELGFCLKDIKDLVSNTALTTIEDKVDLRCEAINKEIEALQMKKQACLSLANRVSKGADIIGDEKHFFSDGDGNPEVRIEEIPEGCMFYSRQIMNQYRSTDVSVERWHQIYRLCTEYAVPTNSPVIITYHTKPLEQFLMKDCDVEFGMMVNPEYEIPQSEELGARMHSWGGFLAATTYHRGSDRDMITTHMEILQWINRHGYRIIGPTSEEFIVSPLDVVDEDLRVTKVIMPIARI